MHIFTQTCLKNLIQISICLILCSCEEVHQMELILQRVGNLDDLSKMDVNLVDNCTDTHGIAQNCNLKETFCEIGMHICERCDWYCSEAKMKEPSKRVECMRLDRCIVYLETKQKEENLSWLKLQLNQTITDKEQQLSLLSFQLNQTIREKEEHISFLQKQLNQTCNEGDTTKDIRDCSKPILIGAAVVACAITAFCCIMYYCRKHHDQFAEKVKNLCRPKNRRGFQPVSDGLASPEYTAALPGERGRHESQVNHTDATTATTSETNPKETSPFIDPEPSPSHSEA